MVIEIDGARLSCAVVGDGEPLLWLHGFMGSGADWRFVFGEIPDGFRLIAPDLRGHGASTNPSGTFSFRQAARDVAGLLDRLGLARVKAIGVSGGGITLLHLATTTAHLESMVLVSAPPYFPQQARAVQRQLSAAMLGEREMDAMRERHAGGDLQIEQLLAQGRQLADSYDDVSFTPPHLATIGAETLIVFGDRDPLYPVSLAFELRAAIPRSHLWVVPNAGHAPVFGQHAGPFAAAALTFLRGGWSPPQ